MARVLAIGDIHLPFTHPLYLAFCQDIADAWRCDKFHFVGDIVDNHALGFWDHDPNGYSAESEAAEAARQLEAWRKSFNGTVSIGNHDDRHYRVARRAGIPDRMIRGHADVWQTPKWDWQFEHVIDGVLYEHGTGNSGKDAARNLAIQKRMSVVIGHIHPWGGVTYHANPTSRIFGCNAGNGIDCKAYAFAYGRSFPVRPTLGCAVIVDGDAAYFEPMPIGVGEKYHRSRAVKARCKNWRRYRGIHYPRCNRGQPCESCLAKFHKRKIKPCMTRS